jgi:hypothetical protein
MRGRLEREIRLLPQVLSCSFTQDDVVVLADLSADAAAIESAVERILAQAGETASIRVIGPSINDPIPSRALTPMLVSASVAGVAVLGVGALVGGLVAVQHPRVKPEERPQNIQAAAPDSRDIRDGLAGIHTTLKKTPGAPPTPGSIPSVLPPTSGIAAEAVSLPRALSHKPAVPEPPAAESISCDNPPGRGAPRERHGRHLGNGPMPWSRSVLVPPHSCEERGRTS